MMGNVVVWKPSNAQIYSAKVLMDIYKEAGYPKGIINMIFPTGPDAAEVIFGVSRRNGKNSTLTI